jgi:hypothetical protein
VLAGSSDHLRPGYEFIGGIFVGNMKLFYMKLEFLTTAISTQQGLHILRRQINSFFSPRHPGAPAQAGFPPIFAFIGFVQMLFCGRKEGDTEGAAILTQAYNWDRIVIESAMRGKSYSCERSFLREKTQ